MSAFCANAGVQMLSPFVDSSVDVFCPVPDFNQSLPKRRLVDSLLHDTANIVIEHKRAVRGHISGEMIFTDVLLLISRHISLVLFCWVR